MPGSSRDQTQVSCLQTDGATSSVLCCLLEFGLLGFLFVCRIFVFMLIGGDWAVMLLLFHLYLVLVSELASYKDSASVYSFLFGGII